VPKGHIRPEYLDGPVDKPLETIYAELDEFTMEFFPDEREYRDRLDIFFALPPLHYDGSFLKGILFTQAADYLVQQFPWVQDLFHVGAYSMCTAYPWSKKADFYLVCYDNRARHRAFQERNPERADRPLIGLQDADFINEFQIFPKPPKEKDIDILCVGKFQRIKNTALLAESLKIYRQKYGVIRAVLVAGQKFDLNFRGLDHDGIAQIRKIQELLIHPQDYLDIVPWVNYYDLPELYSRAKLYTLASYIEGKNRTFSEAMACDVPLVCFEHHNRYARGDNPVFPDRAGLYAPLGAEGLADTFHTALNNLGDFQPRRAFLRESGRRGVLRTLLHRIPYYQGRLPSGRPETELWLDLAVQANHQVSLHSYLYDDIAGRAWNQGIENVRETLTGYKSRFLGRC
jgi:glycosyltransferase involved in cell wall biosynthesis